MKKISVKVVPNSKIEQVQTSFDGAIKVWVKEKPVDGKANLALIELLSKHLDVPKSSIEIISGQKNRNKLIGIKD